MAYSLEHPFGGSALCAVDKGGRLRFPPFVLETLDRRRASAAVTIGSHEADPCLVGYDPAFAAALHADVERRRIAEEPVAPRLHFARARRTFGFVDLARLEAGAIILSPLMRRRALIGPLALIVGAGGTFEIWDVETALERGDADLRDLATFHLEFQQAA